MEAEEVYMKKLDVMNEEKKIKADLQVASLVLD